jgi:hypothetical protein
MATDRNILSRVQTAMLVEHVRKHYPGNGISDTAFAALAAESLGFPVTLRNVVGVRDELGIESEHARRTREARSGQPDLVSAAHVTAQLETLHTGMLNLHSALMSMQQSLALIASRILKEQT